MELTNAISYAEENVLMGVMVQEQYLFGSFAGFLTDIPTRVFLGHGTNTLIMRLVVQAFAMIINAFWIVTAIRYYQNSAFSLKLIPFQAGLFMMQPEMTNNSKIIVEEVVAIVRKYSPISIPILQGPPPPQSSS